VGQCGAERLVSAGSRTARNAAGRQQQQTVAGTHALRLASRAQPGQQQGARKHAPTAGALMRCGACPPPAAARPCSSHPGCSWTVGQGRGLGGGRARGAAGRPAAAAPPCGLAAWTAPCGRPRVWTAHTAAAQRPLKLPGGGCAGQEKVVGAMGRYEQVGGATAGHEADPGGCARQG